MPEPNDPPQTSEVECVACGKTFRYTPADIEFKGTIKRSLPSPGLLPPERSPLIVRCSGCGEPNKIGEA
jgi:hypothetical protein